MEPDKENESKEFQVKYKVEGGEKASTPESDKALYPKGVDPGVASEEYTARGDWTPYSKKQRKVAAILIRKFQSEQNMTLEEATKAAFKEVGDPENLDLSQFKGIKKTVPDLIKHSEIKH